MDHPKGYFTRSKEEFIGWSIPVKDQPFCNFVTACPSFPTSKSQ
jgi:hypothetical protein